MDLRTVRTAAIAVALVATPAAAFAQNNAAPGAPAATDTTAAPAPAAAPGASVPDTTGAIGDTRDDRGFDFGWLGLIGLLGLAGLAKRNRTHGRDFDSVGAATGTTSATTRGGTTAY
jgi:MYXO-CTERM domain-containing protein